MGRWGAVAALIAGAGLVAAAAGTQTGAQEAAVARAMPGKELFLKYCASCHGTDARGGGPVAAGLKKMPSDLTQIAARRGGEYPGAEIARFIDGRTEVVSHGTREMPVWGQQFREELGDDSLAEEISLGRIGALIAYLESIQVSEAGKE